MLHSDPLLEELQNICKQRGTIDFFLPTNQSITKGHAKGLNKGGAHHSNFKTQNIKNKKAQKPKNSMRKGETDKNEWKQGKIHGHEHRYTSRSRAQDQDDESTDYLCMPVRLKRKSVQIRHFIRFSSNMQVPSVSSRLDNVDQAWCFPDECPEIPETLPPNFQTDGDRRRDSSSAFIVHQSFYFAVILPGLVCKRSLVRSPLKLVKRLEESVQGGSISVCVVIFMAHGLGTGGAGLSDNLAVLTGSVALGSGLRVCSNVPLKTIEHYTSNKLNRRMDPNICA